MNGFTTVSQYQWFSGKIKTSYRASIQNNKFKLKDKHKSYLLKVPMTKLHNNTSLHIFTLIIPIKQSKMCNAEYIFTLWIAPNDIYRMSSISSCCTIRASCFTYLLCLKSAAVIWELYKYGMILSKSFLHRRKKIYTHKGLPGWILAVLPSFKNALIPLSLQSLTQE